MRKAILLPAIFLTACSSYPESLPTIHPYKMDIQQGNVVTSKMMLQLRPGMTRAQVRYVMGTPLIADSFHADRWDYLYRMMKDGHVVEQRRVILDFEDDKLKRVRGDVVAASTDASAPAQQPGSHEPITLKPANGTPPKEKGILDKLKFWNGDSEKTPVKQEQPVSDEKLQALPPLLGAPGETPVIAAPKAEIPRSIVTPAPKREEKGLLDKLKFWNKDEPQKPVKPATGQAAAPQAHQLPAIGDEKPVPLPPLMEPQAPEPAAPVPPTKPATAPVPAAKSEPQPKATPIPKPEKKPVAAPAEPKPAPKPAVELPREEDPSYFDKLLEKIGF